MSLTASLNMAIAGLTLQSKRAAVLSSNVASADVPGYARRELSSDGTVRSVGVVRGIDLGLQQMRRDASSDTAKASVAQGFAANLDELIGDPDQTGSLQSLLAKLDAAMTVAASDPTAPTTLIAAADAAANLVDGITGLAESVTQARQKAEDDIASTVAQLNSDLSQVAHLNVDIRRMEALGQDPSDLEDRRAVLVDHIAETVPVRQMQRDNGAIALISKGGVILVDSSAAEVDFTARPAIEPGFTYPADLSGLSVKGLDLGTGQPGDGLAGGTLGALFTLRDEAAPQAMARLDAFAQDLATRFQEATTDPSLAAGEPGLFTDAGATVGAAPVPGLAGRLSLNDLIATDGPERLRQGLGSNPGEPVTSNAQLLRFSDAMAARRVPASAVLGDAPTDLSGLGGRLRSAIALERLRADDAVESTRVATDRLVALRDGAAVDIDTEMQRLLQVEQAYAANARLIQAVGQMMDRITEI
ncbi:flagellar hook-associated protein FlgK [Jannaschia seohaensis]|uniref:Flagellar hook-associated protein 1 n=1 Tax=Jannaschia seohaensis TaxID=475081 RepID=A0A2Y9A2F1_9RHOB|nr:flagellar hook-associated protein FlgK [Jannaschia seohaensis]PWJ22332.1 flagellar hook-associated protein 1 FlgK [Jannaschia seohaensis]SSA38610.1 flagellar hook-associated protein 1 FlgK [Jannaschia seohaensis]